MKDWSTIREAYIRSTKSLRALASEYGVSFHSLGKVCEREGWPLQRRIHADGDGDRTATHPATGEGPLPLSMPQRSSALRTALVTELERDAKVVAATAPANLEVAQARQGVVSAITRNAETVLMWGDKTPAPSVRIDLMSQTFYLNDAGMAVYEDGIRPAPPGSESLRSLPAPIIDTDGIPPHDAA